MGPAQQGLFLGVIDLTTDELADEPGRRLPQRRAGTAASGGLLGFAQIVVPGCIDFTVHGADEV
ncbi:MAG: hypothetical protein U0401_12700 [Anaerolineae bacterium]